MWGPAGDPLRGGGERAYGLDDARRDDPAEGQCGRDGRYDRDGEGDQRRGVKRHVQMAAYLRWYVPKRVADMSAEDPRPEQQGNKQQRQCAGDHDQQLAEQQLRAEAA